MSWGKVVYPAFAGLGAAAGWAVGGPMGVKGGAALGGAIATKAIVVGKIGQAADAAGKRADEAAVLLLKTSAKILDIGANVVLGGYAVLTIAWTGQHLSGWYKDSCSSSFSSAHCFSLDIGSSCLIALTVAGGWETFKMAKILYAKAAETVQQMDGT